MLVAASADCKEGTDDTARAQDWQTVRPTSLPLESGAPAAAVVRCMPVDEQAALLANTEPHIFTYAHRGKDLQSRQAFAHRVVHHGQPLHCLPGIRSAGRCSTCMRHATAGLNDLRCGL